MSFEEVYAETAFTRYASLRNLNRKSYTFLYILLVYLLKTCRPPFLQKKEKKMEWGPTFAGKITLAILQRNLGILFVYMHQKEKCSR